MYLLSFTLPPRAPPPPAYARRSSRRNGASGGSWQMYDKERYLNAQYRFMVKPTEDYTAHFADPDIYLPWSHIVQVLIPTTSALSGATTGLLPSQANDSTDAAHAGATCPICLSPPSAPRITRCGHVFCYPCILHYLATSSEVTPAPRPRNGPYSVSVSGASTPRIAGPVPGAARAASGASASASGSSTPSAGTAPLITVSTFLPRLQKFSKCPICGDPVYARDLKAVKWWDARSAERQFAHNVQPHAGTESSISSDMRSKDEYLTLRLIERPHLTTLALPQSDTWPPQDLFATTPLASHRNSTFVPAVNNDDSESSETLIVRKSHQQGYTASASASATPLSTNSAPWHFLPDVITFAKFMLATPPYLLSSLSENLSELAVERALLDGSMPGSGGVVDELGLVFVEMAVNKVEEQMEKVRIELDTQWVRTRINSARSELSTLEGQLRDWAELDRARAETMRRDRAAKHTPAPESIASELRGSSQEDDETVNAFLATQSTASTLVTTPTAADDTAPRTGLKNQSSRGGRTRRNLNPPAPNSSSSLFYQAASGQNIFLHPLDIKVLRSQYHSYELFPRHLRVKVGGADESSVNEDLRRRCKYLNHLPMSADVVFIEIDWEGMVAEAEAEAKAASRNNVAVEPPSTLEDSTSTLETDAIDMSATITLPPRAVAAATRSPEPSSTCTSKGLPIIKRATIKPYEQALRQRRQRRADKVRKEDRAKTRAEDAERAASAAALAGTGQHYGVLNGGRAVRGLDIQSRDSRSRSGRSEGHDSASLGGGPHSDDQFGRSHSSASEFGLYVGSFDSHDQLGRSPTFADAALVGAERVFAIHPGGQAVSEDFPDMLRRASRNDLSKEDDQEDTDDEDNKAGDEAIGEQNERTRNRYPQQSVQSVSRTVWGTPAAARAWSNTARPGNGQNDDYGWSEMDDAWLELEEDFILGGGSNGQRKMSGAALNKESRGMNAQPAGANHAKIRPSPAVSSRGSAASLTSLNASRPEAPTVEPRDAAIVNANANADRNAGDPSTNADLPGQKKQKVKKKKLILTAGGRGR
ncbi:hypothetical protein OC846_003183 [Tilletia horrida]|uniref:RING-type domain-containing protein n=1 Tax=Tilletia horrida TaxID=155126 RepID=A0AAN6JY70_9BASI|nr:hypothetical protein OC846_003183 [Tilletia horrida]